MENKYGKKQAHCKIQVLACVGVLVIGMILLAACVVVLFSAISKGFDSGKIIAMAILLIVGGAMFGHTVLLLSKAGIDVYENAIVITEVKFPYRLVVREYPAADIFCLLWDGPGANEINSRSYRKNTNTCEIITDGGRTSFRLSDGYYEESYAKAVADFQSRHNISHTLEKRKKGKY